MTWQPIDTAPKDGTPVLACWKENGVWHYVVIWRSRHQVYPWRSFERNAYPEDWPEYWASLPEPPRGD